MLRFLATPDLVPDGFTSNVVRYPIAAIFYLPWLIMGIRRRQLKSFWLIALIPTIPNLICQTLWAWAPYHLSVGMLAFLFRLCGIWGILGAFLLFPDERRLARIPQFWVGTILAFGGFIIMSVTGKLNFDTQITGIILMFFCSLFFGVYTVSIRYVIGKQHPLLLFSIVSIYTSIGLILLAPLGKPASVLELEPFPLTIFILSSIFGIAIAHGLYYVAIQRIGVSLCILALTATPFVSLIIARLVFSERFSVGQWIGGLVLLIGSTAALHSQQYLCPTKPPELQP